MASFDKLKLQGIRGVGPEEKSVQVVEFDKPLTLIAGQNGSGKTVRFCRFCKLCSCCQLFVSDWILFRCFRP